MTSTHSSAPQTIKFQRLLANRVAYALDYVKHCYDLTVFNNVSGALEACEKGERQHRAMAARFTNGAASYRLPVSVAATLMMGRSFFCEADARARGSVADLAGHREDHLKMVLTYARLLDAADRHGHQYLTEALSRLNNAPQDLTRGLIAHGYASVSAALEDWDYSRDVAVR